MNLPEGVLDRIEYSFSIFKRNFFKIIAPFFIFNFIFFWFIYLIFINYIVWIIWNINFELYDNFLSIVYSTQWVLFISIILFLFLLNVFLYIPIILATINITHKTYLNEKVSLEESILFGFGNIFNAFKTYWYMFKYIYLLPAILFIVWWILFNVIFIWDIQGDTWDILKQISIFLMIFSFLLFIVFSIYRWLRASFVLYSATSKEEFTQNNFNLNLRITKGKLWRILWNFLLIGFIVWFLTGFIEWIFNIFIPEPLAILWLEEFIQSLENISSQQELQNAISNSNFEVTFSNITYFISTFVTQLLATIWSVFIIVFTYIFMLRLEEENKNNSSSDIINETENIDNNMVNIKNEL